MRVVSFDQVIQSEIEGEWTDWREPVEFTLAAVAESLCARSCGILSPLPEIERSSMWRAAVSTGWPHNVGKQTAGDSGFRFQILPRDPDDSRSYLLGFALKRTLTGVGFSNSAAMLVRDALQELHNNAIEHSGAIGRPLFGIAIRGARAEFAIADLGIGIPNSLRANPLYSHLRTTSAAIKKAIEPGVSRFNGIEQGRGYGFQDLLKVLTRHWGLAILRSETAVVTIDNATDGGQTTVQSVPRIEGCQLYLSIGLSRSPMGLR
jgi:hypothetical protein